MIYLATKYSDPDPEMQEYNYRLALSYANKLMQQFPELNVYSSIIHYHDLAQSYGLPTDASFWELRNHGMILLSEAVYVAQTFSWQKSKGVISEIAFAEKNGIAVKYVRHNIDKGFLELFDESN